MESVADRILSRLRAFADELKDGKGWKFFWDSEPVARSELIETATQLSRYLKGFAWLPTPDVHLMMDGCIMFEWRGDGDVIVRIEVVEWNALQVMVTFPDRPAVFEDLNWGIEDPTSWIRMVEILMEHLAPKAK